MKRIAFLLLLFAVVTACKKEKKELTAPGKILRDYQKNECRKQCLTSKTADLMEKAVSKGIVGEEDMHRLTGLDGRNSFEILEEKVEASRARITVRFTGNNRENMKGTVYVYRLSLEDGEWKIEMEKELSEMLKASPAGGPGKYIKEKASQY